MQKTINFCNMTPQMTRRLNEIAESDRGIFTEFVDDLSLKYKDCPFWWFTPLASRNTGVCSCFYEICLLKLILEVAAKERPEQMIVPSVWMQRAAAANLPQHKKIRIRVQDGSNPVKNLLKNNRRIHSAYTCYLLKKRVGTVQKYASAADIRSIRNKEITLVCTYCVSSQFHNGVFLDRYFPGLLEHTDENIVYFVQLDFHTIEEGRILAENVAAVPKMMAFEQFVEEQDYRKVREYCDWCMGLDVSECRMDGMDITELADHAVNMGSWNLNAAYGVLKAVVLLRLIKKYKMKVRQVIDWYEAQPGSNGMVSMLRKKYPKIPTIAYVLSPCPENNIGLYPSKLQVGEKTVPEYYAVQGSAWEQMARQFDRHVRCIPAPSFRYQKIFDVTYEEWGEDTKRKGVLLVLSYTRDASAHLLKQFFQAVCEWNGLRVFIKNHPCNEGFRLADYGIHEAECIHCKVCFISGTMEDALKNVEMAVMTETSSGLEVTLRGVYTVLFAAPGRLINTCFPNAFKPYVAYDAQDLRRLIKMREQFLPDADRLLRIREQTFLKTDRETVSDFLKMKELNEKTIAGEEE